MRYVNLNFVNQQMEKFESNDFWSLMTDPAKTARIDWAEYLINLEPFIGYKINVDDTYAFPRNLITSAKTLGILDVGCEEGVATEEIQRMIYNDHLKEAPNSIQQAVAQLIDDWISFQDLKDLADLQLKANLEEFDTFVFKEPSWQKALPRNTYDIIQYLKPSAYFDENTTEIVRA